MFKKKVQEEDPVTTLARCIAICDDLRAYRRKDVDQVDQMFSALKKSKFKEHYDMWVKARPAAESIVDMPYKAPKVRGMITTLSWLKVANRVALIILVVFLSVQIVPVWKKVLGPHPLGGNGFIYSAVAIALVVVSMNAGTFLDYKIRRRIIAYEDQTKDKYAPARERMKDCVNRMMRSLAKEAQRSGKGAEYYSLVVYFDDYENIQVVKQWKPKSMGLFKKSYNHYQIVPKL